MPELCERPCPYLRSACEDVRPLSDRSLKCLREKLPVQKCGPRGRLPDVILVQIKDLLFLTKGTKRDSPDKSHEPQVPPLRCAPVGMTILLHNGKLSREIIGFKTELSSRPERSGSRRDLRFIRCLPLEWTIRDSGQPTQRRCPG